MDGQMDRRTDGWTDGETDGQMDGRMDVHIEFLPILQDFVPSWGRCPATLCNFKTAMKQGKGTANHMMPLGDLLYDDT